MYEKYTEKINFYNSNEYENFLKEKSVELFDFTCDHCSGICYDGSELGKRKRCV